MDVIFYKTDSPKIATAKTITNGTTYSVQLKENTTIENPVIIVTGYNEIDKNYCYIADFNRYYFIGDKTILTGNRTEIELNVDVATTYATEILNSEQLIMRNEYIGLNMIPDTQHPIAPYANTRVIKFDKNVFFQGFDEYTSCFLLTVAGK